MALIVQKRLATKCANNRTPRVSLNCSRGVEGGSMMTAETRGHEQNKTSEVKS